MLNSGWEKKIWLRICQKKPLSGRDIDYLVWDYSIEDEDGDSDRWTTDVVTIIQFNGHYYRVYWRRGNTEYQKNVYESQVLEEVEQRTVLKEVTEWVVK